MTFKKSTQIFVSKYLIFLEKELGLGLRQGKHKINLENLTMPERARKYSNINADMTKGQRSCTERAPTGQMWAFEQQRE